MVRRQRQSGSRSRTRPAPRRSRKPHDTDAETRVAVLTRELSQALEQQAATSEVLQVISSSPSELEPVFQAMLAHATRLCEANFGVLYRFDGHVFHAVALQNACRPSAIIFDANHHARTQEMRLVGCSELSSQSTLPILPQNGPMPSANQHAWRLLSWRKPARFLLSRC